MTRFDLLIIVVAVAALPLFYWQFWGPNYPGTDVDIIVASEKPQRHSLLRNQTLLIHGRLGDSIVSIKNGKAAFIGSPCPNKQCIRSGWLDHNGETAACLPNGIMLSVIGDGIARFDSINF